MSERLTRRQLITGLPLLGLAGIVGPDRKELGNEPLFQRWDMGDGMVFFTASANQVLTAQDGTGLSIYSSTNMKEGDKIYDLRAPSERNLRAVRENLGWSPTSGGSVQIVARNGVVTNIRFGEKTWSK